jgi:hypothetical protein
VAVEEKAATMRDCVDKLIGQYDSEGKHLTAFQIARAFSELPEESLARFYDILMRIE